MPDPERGAMLDEDSGKPRRFSSNGSQRSGRATSYLLVLMVGIILLLGFTAFGKQPAPKEIFIEKECSCPETPATNAASAEAALQAADAERKLREAAAMAVSKPVPEAPPRVFTKRAVTNNGIESVLITGAAGFIGSHFALLLMDQGGYKITAIDDMSRASWDTVLRLKHLAETSPNTQFQFVKQDLADAPSMAQLMRDRGVDAVVHFAGNAYVGESMSAPDKYFQNITVGTLQLLRAMDDAGVQNLIFSSSCATYGEPKEFPITEDTPQRPTNPYGLSKLHAEQSILSKSAVRRKQGARFAVSSLRYFNVIGADPAGRLGPVLKHKEQWDYPRVVDAAMDAALGLRPKLQVMGGDFPTPDGTAVRDYIHVSDLVQAHLDALTRLDAAEPMVYNVGVGHGATVKEVVQVVEKVSGRTVPYELVAPRPGDPHTLYSDPAKIKAELGWEPKYGDLEKAIATAWQWRLENYPTGPQSTIDPLAFSGPAYTQDTDDTPPLKDDPRILIVGAGPTGLCAAYRLKELGYTNWELIDKSSQAGGLATSITDSKGFTWDIGVHVLFSHFAFFDALLDEYLEPKDWLYHQRWSPAWMRQRWVGYPIQSNVWRLPEDEVAEIVADLATLKPDPTAQPRNFLEWLNNGFGKALTKAFMAPYNFKVWAHPPEQLNTIWVGERVATIKFGDILSNVINRRDAPAWGPNAQFRYPMNGTGHIWEAVFQGLPKEHIKLSAEVKTVHTDEGAGAGKPGDKSVELVDGTRIGFDALLSTVPVDRLLKTAFPDKPEMAQFAEGEDKFKHQTVNLVGVGVWGQPPTRLNGVHWVYFPEEEFPFYRVTVLSNFSPLVVAKPFEQWSLLVEVSESKYRPVPKSKEELEAKVLEGLRKATMLPEDSKIESVWSTRLEYGYPVPYVERNMHMHKADHALRQMHIWSRGRFGSWKYEVANQDHSCMLGVDAIDAMLFGGNDDGIEATFNSPSYVNNRYRKYDRVQDPAKLAAKRARTDGAPRQHTRFEKPWVELKTLATWAAVTWHCHESDAWASAFKAAVPDTRTKYFVYSYERCGMGDIKRPATDMLYEGLHHLDRIPKAAGSTNASAVVGHIAAKFASLPEVLLVVRPGAQTGHVPKALRDRMAATNPAPLLVPEAAAAPAPEALDLSSAPLCATYKAAMGVSECPASAVGTGAWALVAAPRSAFEAVGKDRWAAIAAALDSVGAAASPPPAAHEKLVLSLLPQLLGIPAPVTADRILAPELAAAPVPAVAPTAASVPAVQPTQAAVAGAASSAAGTAAAAAPSGAATVQQGAAPASTAAPAAGSAGPSAAVNAAAVAAAGTPTLTGGATGVAAGATTAVVPGVTAQQ